MIILRMMTVMNTKNDDDNDNDDDVFIRIVRMPILGVMIMITMMRMLANTMTVAET